MHLPRRTRSKEGRTAAVNAYPTIQRLLQIDEAEDPHERSGSDELGGAGKQVRERQRINERQQQDDVFEGVLWRSP
jgi:hypothetical protein